MTIYHYSPVTEEFESREVQGETDTHWILPDGSHEPKSAWTWFKTLGEAYGTEIFVLGMKSIHLRSSLAEILREQKQVESKFYELIAKEVKSEHESK